MRKFPVIHQYDSMQCGIACLQMVCKYFGRDYSLESLSKLCFATTEGVSMLGINEAANTIGLQTTCARTTIGILCEAPLPCIIHWNQNHFVVLYKGIILASTRKGETILDPFAGSCTTGIAANLLGRKFIGIEQDEKFIALGRRRKLEIQDEMVAAKMLKRMSENPQEIQVLVNHAHAELLNIMIEKGICYMRAGNAKGSILVTPGFERMGYVLLHTNGGNCHMFKLKKKGCFQIWTKETLEENGFHPEHAAYYMVLHFDNKKEINFSKSPKLRQGINTYRSKIRPLSDFIGLE